MSGTSPNSSDDDPDGEGTLIEFLCDPALMGQIPEPQRAARFVPEWFRSLPREAGIETDDGQPSYTVKACAPVTDAFALGYIIPLPYDFEMNVAEDRLDFDADWSPDCLFDPVEKHRGFQLGVSDTPFAGMQAPKFKNPWRVKVPHGYSVLSTPCLGRPDLPYTCFSGVVDCDRYETVVHFPFAWTGPTGHHRLKAGEPMIHCIPFRRDAQIKQHGVRAASPEEQMDMAVANIRLEQDKSVYRTRIRTKK